MTKIKTNYACVNCYHQTPKWLGCCPECKQWNTIELDAKFNQTGVSAAKQLAMKELHSITAQSARRITSGIKEWDRVMGGGIVPGAFMVVTGDPGIGKSTLLLQVANKISEFYTIFYFSSEESLEQVKQRAERIQCTHSKIFFSDQSQLEDIIATAQASRPDIVIIDSIQNCYTSENHLLPGSIGQLKESAYKLMRLAKDNMITVIVSGHITKDGAMAGPKTLEHMVDTVVYLQGEDRWQTRILRAVKNRFGTVNELGFFEMQEHGLQEMSNINQFLLQEISHVPGSVLISYIEGSRPLLLELQALTIATKYGNAQRVISGIDTTQVVLIAAILEKYVQISLSSHDIFFKVSGGFKIKGSGADLGIALALLSTFFQQPLPEKCMAMAEISLTGHIKPINNINLQIKEAEKFGIKEIFIAQNQKIDDTVCKIRRFSHICELLSVFE